MSPFETRKAKALELLRGTGMRESNYLLPGIRLFWRLGVPVPPPHFLGFLTTTALFGVFFGVIWGLSMWLFLWRHQGTGLGAACMSALLAGLLFGLCRSVFIALERRKHALPAWEDLA